MLRTYTAIATILAAAIGIDDCFRESTRINGLANCQSHAVICVGSTAYHWASSLLVAAVALAFLLWVGWPTIIAGRIGKRRNRRGYLAGIFFSWLGLAWVMLRPAHKAPPVAFRRALQDYRARE